MVSFYFGIPLLLLFTDGSHYEIPAAQPVRTADYSCESAPARYAAVVLVASVKLYHVFTPPIVSF